MRRKNYSEASPASRGFRELTIKRTPMIESFESTKNKGNDFTQKRKYVLKPASSLSGNAFKDSPKMKVNNNATES